MLCAASPAAADIWDDCKQTDDLDLKTDSCTRIIDSGNESNEDLAVAHNFRGIAYGVREDFDRAIAEYNRAIELDPDFALPYANRAYNYSLMKDFD